MKKLLSFALVLAMILGSVSMVFATSGVAYTDTKGIEEEEAINVLTGLGVVEGYGDGTFKPTKLVKRSEMVRMICAALNLHVVEGNEYPTKFTDVAPTAWYAGYVYYAVNLGIVEGKSDTIFDPEAPVKYDEAITMVMRALGYTEECLNGSYPSCFVSKAVGLGALKGLKAGTEAANRADCAQLVYNVLQANIGKVGADGKWEAFNYTGAGMAEVEGGYDNMLRRLGAMEDKDSLLVVGVDVENGDDNVLIDLSNYLGHQITVYRTNDSDENIVAINEVKTTEFVGQYKDGKLAGNKVTSNFTIESTTDAAIHTFENGTLKDFEVKEKTDYTWAVLMKSGKPDSVVSVLAWNVNAAKKVEKSDLKTIDSKTPSLLGYEFTLDEDDEIDMDSFELVGVDSLDDIAEKNVVYVYANNEDKIVKVEVGTEVVEGKISKVSKDGEPTVDGSKYSLAKVTGAVAATTVKDFAKIDVDVELYLDVNGKLFALDSAKAKETGYSLFLKYQKADDEKTIDGSVAKIQVFTAEGEVVVYEIGKLADDSADPAALVAGNVVKLRVDEEENEVTNINLIKMGDAEEVKVNKKGVTTPNNNVLEESVVVFQFDGETAADKKNGKKWSVADGKSLFNKTVTVAFDEENKVAVVTKLAAETKDSDYVVVIDYEYIAKNYNVTVLADGEEAVFKISKDNTTEGAIKAIAENIVTLTMKDDETFTKFNGFTAKDEDYTYEYEVEDLETALEVKNGNLTADGKHFSFADDAIVYVKNGSKWTVEDVDYLNGLKNKDSAKPDFKSVTLYDTVKSDKGEYYNIVVVVK